MPAFSPRVWSMRDANRPKDAVYVGRPSKWGNPFTHLKGSTYAHYQVRTIEDAVKQFAEWVRTQPELIQAARRELRGKDLVCWGCSPCHANVWIQIANENNDVNTAM